MGTGTGGTLTGIGRYLKEKNPEIKVVAVDPEGSIMMPGSIELQPYYIEGIGDDFIPRTMDWSIVDDWVKVSDKESFEAARSLLKREGLLVGGSSGCAFLGAQKIARELGPDKWVVFICPDGIRNYLTKFLSDDWMYEEGFISEESLIESARPKLVPD